jgi:serine/threonine protein kinase
MKQAIHDPIHEPVLGETIDGFHLEKILYEGKYNNLYHVTHPDFDSKLIMKVPCLGISVPASAFSAFETEAQILSRLHGVHAPRILAVGDMASCPYFVMEHIEGIEMIEAARQAPVSVEKLCEIMVPVCKAIHELHRHNIIHLDLKPDNIRNRANGEAVILDFGTAHQVQMPDMYEDQKDGAPRSFNYVAPEQLNNVRHESRSDIYALGVIMYQLATGKFPYGESNPITVSKRLYLPAVPPRAVKNDIPPWLQEVILTCLRRRPDNRFATAKQLAYFLAHPDMVKLSKRANWTRKPGMLKILQSWFFSKSDYNIQAPELYPYTRTMRTPHILVALDLGHSSEDLKQALRSTLWRLANSDKSSFFTILTVVEKEGLSRTQVMSGLSETAHATHIHKQIELRHWMQLLKLPDNRVNYQVLSGNPATAILAYAEHHSLDQIVIGARGSSTMRRFTGSVSSKVAAEAPCTVTVVRSHLDEHKQKVK